MRMRSSAPRIRIHRLLTHGTPPLPPLRYFRGVACSLQRCLRRTEEVRISTTIVLLCSTFTQFFLKKILVFGIDDGDVVLLCLDSSPSYPMSPGTGYQSPYYPGGANTASYIHTNIHKYFPVSANMNHTIILV